MGATDPLLRDLRVLVVDCQSTGASPTHGHLLEIGWAHASASHPQTDAVHTSLVVLPEGARIPAVVRRITGVRDEDMLHARTTTAVWTDLADAIERTAVPPVPTVIHFARFEAAFLRELVAQQLGASAAFPFDLVCTHEIGRRLLPDLPRMGLRALAGYFGRRAHGLERSGDHVEATAFVWHHVVDMLADAHGVARLSELRRWLGETSPPRSGVRAYPMPRAKRLALPDAPGVYRFLDASGHLLYVGKATSLRRRVNSYFQKQHGVTERALELLTQARDLDVTEVATPLEAALLETDEIKRHAPPYNRALVVDRRDVWFCDAAFGGLSSRASVRRPLGPFGGRSLPRGFAALLRIVAAAPHAPQPGDIAAALPGRSADGIPEPTCVTQAVQRFVATLAPISGTALDAAGLLRLGHVMWPQLVHDDDEPAPEPDDGHAIEAAPQWDPERVADALVELCARFAHGLRRARWLVRLSESTIVFSEPSPSAVVRRILHVRGGDIVDRGHLPTDATLPIPPGWHRTHRARRRAFDLLTHDRLRVLTSELRRVVSAGQEVRVRFGPSPELGPDRLRRLFAWI